MANFLFLTGGNSNSGSAYQLFASCRNQGGETAGSVAYDSSVRTFGGETAGSIASSSTGCSSVSSSSCSFSAIA
ncbi:MAG: hypothetical protein IJD48_00440 [Clostridia bacterium]|nr:hypothetical protein [Clostridia bacterium]